MNISDYSEKEFNKTEFTILKELNKYHKYYNESKIVSQEYFNNDFDMENYIKHEDIITKKYNDDKEKKNLTDFTHFILENYPPLTLTKTIDEFKKNPSVKKLVVWYSKSYTKIYKNLIYKEKIREKINSLISEMFNYNVQLKSIEDDNGGENDDENNNI